MTDLIPRDAVRNVVAKLGQEFLDGGSPTAANVLNLAADRINTIHAVDPAAIREAALREAAAKCAEHAEAARKKLGAAQTREEANAWALIVTRCDLLEEAIIAMIGEKI